jgi:site-specific DNA-cytosine methylase
MRDGQPPLAIDLFCGLGGWTDGLLAEGFEAVGFDVERHNYGTGDYPAQLVLQDVLTIHGKQFKDVALIVASPPCQEFSYMSMPWTRAKQIERALRGTDEFPEGYTGSRTVAELTALFDACFCIQQEASEAAGRFIPLIVENVRGAEKWVGRARWHYGSFYLWGDVPALMPIAKSRRMKFPANCGPRLWSEREYVCLNDGNASAFHHEGATKNTPHAPTGHRTNPGENGTKQGGEWWHVDGSISRITDSKSNARKAASAAIAKIPFPLARWIAEYWKPRENCDHVRNG